MCRNNPEDNIKKGKLGFIFSSSGIWSAIDDGIDNYRSDNQDRLETICQDLGMDIKEALSKIERVAKAVVEGAQNLSVLREEIPKDVFKLAWEGSMGDKKSEVMWREICNAVAYEIAYETLWIAQDAPERLWNLLFIAHKSDLKWKSLEFLKRVVRCYIFGFDPECVVMCRSALEAVFDSEIPNDDCVEIFGTNERRSQSGEPQFNLYHKILVAKQKQRISEQIAAIANKVREAGNNTVHQWPKVPKSFDDSFEVIRDTLQVIEELT